MTGRGIGFGSIQGSEKNEWVDASGSAFACGGGKYYDWLRSAEARLPLAKSLTIECPCGFALERFDCIDSGSRR